VARHAYRDGEGEMILAARHDPGTLTVRVRDTGRWTDGTQSDEGGWGFCIIRALFDDVHVHGTPYGTTVIMRRALDPPTKNGNSASARGLEVVRSGS